MDPQNISPQPTIQEAPTIKTRLFLSFSLITASLLLLVGGLVGGFYLAKRQTVSPATPIGVPTIPKYQLPTQKLITTIQDKTKNNCVTAGCNNELCVTSSDSERMGVSICVYLQEYACLSYSRCETQAGGKCGWTKTEEYQRCFSQISEKNKIFCGGITGKLCPTGYNCKYDGTYPDAGGTCIKE